MPSAVLFAGRNLGPIELPVVVQLIMRRFGDPATYRLNRRDRSNLTCSNAAACYKRAKIIGWRRSMKLEHGSPQGCSPGNSNTSGEYLLNSNGVLSPVQSGHH